jgi:CRAL/TRIO domain
MGFRAKRSMGFKKFQGLFTFMVLVLQVAVKELVDADSSRTYPYEYQWPAIQWACESLLDIHLVTDPSPVKQSTRDLCLRIRGGRLGKGSGRKEAVIDAPVSTQTTKNFTQSETIVVQKAASLEFAPSPAEGRDDVESSPIDSAGNAIPETYVFSVFHGNDGSESDPDGIPRRFLAMQHGNREKAKKALEATIEWRKGSNIDSILARPHPKFDVCKKVFPHYFCGRDDTNHVILLQRPGLISIPIAKANGLTGEDLLFHYVYEMEYLWQITERENPDATMTSVIDLTGLNVSVLRRADLLRTLKMFCTTMDAHFPLRSHRTLLINAPKWFGAVYKLVSPLLRESTKQKITILSKGKLQDETLESLLSECPLPPGKSIEDFPASEMEMQLRAFVSIGWLAFGHQ